MSNKEAFEKYFKSVVGQMYAENQKVPVDGFRNEANEYDAQLWAPDWFQYMIFGRGPGKQPPPERMLSWVERNPDVLAQARQTFKYITEKGLAYIIGRKIGQSGTAIYRGEKKGVGFIEAMEANMPTLLEGLVRNEAIKIQTSLHKAIKNGT